MGEVGFILVASIGGGLLAGVLLDRWLGTGPALTLVLLFAGIAAGLGCNPGKGDNDPG